MLRYPYAVERALDHFPAADPEDLLRRLRLGTFVSLPKRYIYFEVRKAGCTQMRHLLRRIEGSGPIRLFADETTCATRRDMFVHARANVPLPSLIDLDNPTQREVLEAPDLLRFTVVRNPYSRLLSAWRGNVLNCEVIWKDLYVGLKGRLPAAGEKPLISFAELVDHVERTCGTPSCDPHWMPQTECTAFPAMNFNFVGKVERFDEVLRRLEQHLGLTEPLAAERRNESLPLGRAGYSEDLAAKVHSIYRTDFDTFGYERDSWARYKETSADEQSRVALSEERVLDEIVERNLVILALFEERKRLRTRVRWARRLGLLPLLDSLAAAQLLLRRAGRKARRLSRAILPPAGNVSRHKHTAARLERAGAAQEDVRHEATCLDSNSRL